MLKKTNKEFLGEVTALVGSEYYFLEPYKTAITNTDELEYRLYNKYNL